MLTVFKTKVKFMWKEYIRFVNSIIGSGLFLSNHADQKYLSDYLLSF